MAKKKSIQVKFFAWLTLAVLVVFLAEQIVLTPAVLKAEFNVLPEGQDDKVVILAEEELMNSRTEFPGLSESYRGLRNISMEKRIRRYAQDIQRELPDTDVSIVSVNKNESPVSIAGTLKQSFYTEGLKGLIIIGNVPMPVINKKGNRFVSLYPYTDFENPAHVYNPTTEFFEPSETRTDYEPEVWHGVMQFDADEEYAVYLDKNHLYHEGEEEFTNFEEKIFYGDPSHTAGGLNSSLISNYQNFVNNLESIAYSRFTKSLLQQVSSNFNSETDLDVNIEDTQAVPDIHTKSLIEKYLSKAAELFGASVSEQSSALLGTGRYGETDYLSPMIAVARKDEYMMQYFKMVNTMLENQIDQLVNEAQQDIEIPRGATLSGSVTYRDTGTTSGIQPVKFVNNAPAPTFLVSFNAVREESLAPDSPAGLQDLINIVYGSQDFFIMNMNQMVNGTPLEDLESAADCRIHRGSTQITKNVREFDGQCYSPWQGGDNEDSWQERDALNCTQFYGANLKDEYRTELAEDAVESQTTHEACFNMRPLSTFLNLLNSDSGLSDDQRLAQADGPVNANNITLNIDDGGSFPLGSVLEDPNDWNEWSSFILGNPVRSSFTIQDPFGETNAIESITLDITKLGPTDPISSVVHHKDPDADIIQKAFEGMTADFLPIDQQRFVTYVDQNGDKQKINYPNLFTASNLNEFLDQISEIEEQLGATNQLLNLVSADSDTFNEELTEVSMASRNSVQDFLSWHASNLNQKYSSILRGMLNENASTAMTNMPESFEIAVLTSEADAEGLNYQLVEEEAFGIEPDEFTAEQEGFVDEYEQQEDTRDLANQSRVERDTNSIPLLEWLNSYIPGWVESVRNTGLRTFQPQGARHTTYEETIRNSDAEIAQIQLSAGAENISLNGPSDRQLTIKAVDTNGDRVVGTTDYFTLQASGPVSLSQNQDADPSAPGIQVFMVSGEKTISYTPEGPGQITFNISYNELEQEITQTVHETLNTEITLEQNSVQAGTTGGISFSVRVINEAGENLQTARPQISLDNTALGGFTSLTELNQSDVFNYLLTPSTKAGELKIMARYEGADPDSQTLTITPSNPVNLFFPESQTSLSGEQTINLTVLDQYENKVPTEIPNVSINVSSEEKVELLTPTVNIQNGEAEIRVSPTGEGFGNVFIRADKVGFSSAYHKLVLSDQITRDELNNFSTSALYFELRTGRDDANHVARKLTSNGKTQATSTLTAAVQGARPIVYVHPTGAIEQIEQNLVKVTTNIGESEISSDIFDNRNRQIASVVINPNELEWGEGITSNALDPSVSLSPEDNRVIRVAGQEAYRITDSGVPIALDNQYNIRSKNGSRNFALELYRGNQVLAEINYDFDREGAVRVVPFDHPEIQHKSTKTLPSSSAPDGTVFYNPNLKVTNDQIPSSGQLRAEDSLETELVGLREGTKSILLFSAGQTAGEANRPYLSEAGMLIGDPTIKLPPTENFSVTNQMGYDIGKYLGRTNGDVTTLLNRDDRILIADAEGTISVLDKETLEFHKNLIKIPSGIKELKEFEDQILVLTQEQCRSNDSCVYNLTEEGELLPIDLNTDSKIIQLFPADFTGDGDQDLGVLTERRNLVVYLNRDGQIAPNGGQVGSTTTTLDETQNLASTTWISNPEGQFQVRYLVNAPQSQTTSSADGQITEVNQTEPEFNTTSFSSLSQVEALSASTVRASDNNGGTLRDGDTVTYTVTLNSEGTSFTDAVISLALGPNFEVLEDSLSDETLNFIQTEQEGRSHLVSGINLPSGATTQFSFQAHYSFAQGDPEPIVQVTTDEPGYEADGLPDFKITLPGTNFTTYYYSQFDEENNRLTFNRLQTRLDETEIPDDAFLEPEDIGEDQSFARGLAEQAFSADADIDGIPDAYDYVTNGLNNYANDVESVIKNLLCDGGCLAVPYNHAFLVPGSFVTLPAFGWACAPPIPIWPPTPYQTCVWGRIYISPTLTGELVSATCIGPFLGAWCYPIRIGNLGKLCDRINAGIQDLLSQATGYIDEAGGSIINVGDSASGESGTNIQVPGFPGVLTDWVTAQIEEITNKIFDLPDITVIYPDISSLVGRTEVEASEVDYFVLEDILAEVNAMPLFNITTTTHYIKYPTISADELTKYETQIKSIIEANIDSVKRALEQWGCYAEPVSREEFVAQLENGDLLLGGSSLVNECLTLELGFFELLTAFEANLEALKEYRDLVKNIFEIQNFLADYANQILGYAEAILDNTAGYLGRNAAALEAWQQLFIQIQNILEDFQILLDVFINYQEACDECRTSRTEGLFQVVLNTFLTLPELPVISVPKLPDITIDVSQIEAQTEIELPALDFKPEPLTLPDLSPFVIILPDAPPINFSARLGEYGLSFLPVLPGPPDIEQLIIDLPDLPELQIPVLPEIPQPPNVDGVALEFVQTIEPALDAVNAVLRIFCLIKKGFIPVPEASLKGQIEGMTARPLNPVLPIDIGFGFQAPQFETTYLDEIRIILETHLDFDLSILNNETADLVEAVNEFQADLIADFNEKLESAVGIIPSGEIEVPDVDLPEIDVDVDIEESLGAFRNEMQKFNSQLPEEINLVATTKTIDNSKFNGIDLDREFEIPENLAHQISTLIAYKEKIDNPSSTLLASINETNPEPQHGVDNIQKFTIAQDSPAGVPQTSPEFNANSGLYIYDEETSSSEKIVRYGYESEKPVELLMMDEDLVYSKGNELFFKEGLRRDREERIPGRRIEITSFEDFSNEMDQTSAVEVQGVEVSSGFEEASFTINANLTGQTVVIDTYHSGLDTPQEDTRFVITQSDQQTSFTEVNNVDLEEGRITKERFNRIMHKTGNPERVTIPLENRAYVVSIAVVNSENLDYIARRIPVTPNVCSDKTGPIVVAQEGTQVQASVSQPIEIDLSNSEDPQTRIVEYFIDLNLAVDEDDDGDATNDRNLQGTGEFRDNPRFILDAIDEEGTFQIAVWAIDEAGNATREIITITVGAPNVFLDSVTQEQVTGHLEPAENDVTVELVRQREGVVEEIAQTESTESGTFTFERLTVSDKINLLDAENNRLFEISKSTGSIAVTDSGASTQVISAVPGGNPTQIQLREGGVIITTMMRVPDSNNDVEIVDTKPANRSLGNREGVIATDERIVDEYELKSIPGDDPGYAGGAAITRNDQRQVIIDTDGSIIMLNENLEVALEEVNNTNRYQWFEIYEESDHIASIFVGTGEDELQLGIPEHTPREAGEAPETATDTEPVQEEDEGFVDIPEDDPDREELEFLQEVGVIEGVQRNGQTFFEPDRFLSRAEYAAIILRTLCIQPRPESFEAPQAFSDIPFTQNLPWYYDETKETRLQGLFFGYLGERDSETGLTPFKPENTITRAEATKVILEALELTEIIDMGEVPEAAPWYEPFIEIAQDLQPYLITETDAGQNFIITSDEASAPERFVTRREFAIMAYRVLLIQNCRLADDDNDGIPYHYEEEHGLDPNEGDGSQDNDADGLSNLDEYNQNSDPNAPTNQVPRPDTDPGVYLDRVECTSCPCAYRLEDETDIIDGDRIFAIIRDTDEEEVFSRSNTLTYRDEE